MCARQFGGFGVQARPVRDNQNVDVVRPRIFIPYYYGYIRQYEEETWRRRVVGLQVEMTCIHRSSFDALNGPPFPAMSTLARQLRMRNVTMMTSPEALAYINGRIDETDAEMRQMLRELQEEDEDVQEMLAPGQPAHFHEGNWIQLWLKAQPTQRCIPVTVRLPRDYDDPSRIDIDPVETIGYVSRIYRVRPPQTLIRLRQFADPDRADEIG